MDETYIKAKGEKMFLHKDVDKQGNMVDFSLTIWTNEIAAHKFLLKANGINGCQLVIECCEQGSY